MMLDAPYYALYFRFHYRVCHCQHPHVRACDLQYTALWIAAFRPSAAGVVYTIQSRRKAVRRTDFMFHALAVGATKVAHRAVAGYELRTLAHHGSSGPKKNLDGRLRIRHWNVHAHLQCNKICRLSAGIRTSQSKLELIPEPWDGADKTSGAWNPHSGK